MKHIFVINPVAGDGKAQKRFITDLQERQLSMYLTRCRGDAEEYVRKNCRDSAEPVRFYACGGDGTLSEVANGAFGFSHSEVGCFPIGSGNDFIRNFDVKKERFLDIDSQMAGQSVPVDMIAYEANGRTRYAVNMFNIGFDCNVVRRMMKIKGTPFASGSMAYLLAVGIEMIKKEGTNLSVCGDEGEIYRGPMLLTAVANGAFCGGGFKGLPRAAIDDGRMDVSVVLDVARRHFVSLLPKYAKGTHLEDKLGKKIVRYSQVKTLTIEPAAGKMFLCMDGEVEQTGKVEFRIEPLAIRFAVPQKE